MTSRKAKTAAVIDLPDDAHVRTHPGDLWHSRQRVVRILEAKRIETAASPRRTFPRTRRVCQIVPQGRTDMKPPNIEIAIDTRESV